MIKVWHGDKRQPRDTNHWVRWRVILLRAPPQEGIKLARIGRRNMDILRHANSMWRRSCGFHPTFLHVTAFNIHPSFISGPVVRRDKRNFWTIVLAGFLSIQGPVCIRRKFWTIRRLRQCCLLAFRVGRENASDPFEERPEAWQTCTDDAEGKLSVGPDTCRHVVPCQSVRLCVTNALYQTHITDQHRDFEQGREAWLDWWRRR